MEKFETPNNISNISQAARFAVIFPGQGSQSVGMLADWYENFHQVRNIFNQASDVLGFDIWAIAQGNDTKHNLDDTAFTQPVLLTASMAIWQVLRAELDIMPAYLAGHSLGEYSALCASGVLGFDDAVRLVYQRGQYMKDAMQHQEGKMSAVLGLDDEQVRLICEQIEEFETDAIVSAANFNAVGQVVIAGNVLGVDLASEQIASLGNKAVPLKVSVPSHCRLMQPASDKLADSLSQIAFNAPNIPVIQNRHARVESDINAIKQALIEQLSLPVLWSNTQNKLADKHMQFQIECGSGNVLTNLAKRQAEKIPAIATDKVTKLAEIAEMLQKYSVV
nr:ACP S-malonyltransferase [Moraxella macacae]